MGSDHDDLSLNGVIGNADKRIDQNQFYDWWVGEIKLDGTLKTIYRFLHQVGKIYRSIVFGSKYSSFLVMLIWNIYEKTNVDVDNLIDISVERLKREREIGWRYIFGSC